MSGGAFQPPFLPPRARYPTSNGDGRVVERIQLDDGGPAPGAILGLPFDAATPTRPGSRRGPDAFRTALAGFAADRHRERWPIGSRLTDLGDLDLSGLGVASAHARVREEVRTVLDRVDRLIAIGGDHSLTFPLFQAHVDARGGGWGLITLDAHHDVRAYAKGTISSSTSVRRCVELDAIDARHVVQIGIRPFANASAHRGWCEDRGITIYDVDAVRDRGAKRIAETALEIMDGRVDHVYVSVDLNVIDQAQAPGTSAAAPDGLSVAELLDALFVLAAAARFAGGDIMELSPRWDWGGETARVAARAFLAVASAGWPRVTAGAEA